LTIGGRDLAGVEAVVVPDLPAQPARPIGAAAAGQRDLEG